MSRLILLMVLITSSFAGLNMERFESDFVQKITDDQNKTITYKGHLYFQAPNRTLWIYEQPLPKKILFNGEQIIVIEPELEQVTITKLKKGQNILSLLKQAKQIAKDRYELEVEKKRFHIQTQEGRLKNVRYTDDLGNEVVIEFKNPKQNAKMDENLFKLDIPAHYDRIYQ